MRGIIAPSHQPQTCFSEERCLVDDRCRDHPRRGRTQITAKMEDVERLIVIALVGLAMLISSWALMIVLARRLPPGLAKDLATVLPACATTARRLRKDPRVPRRAKVAVGFAGLWVLSPST
jgi:hypothetical protein